MLTDCRRTNYSCFSSWFLYKFSLWAMFFHGIALMLLNFFQNFYWLKNVVSYAFIVPEKDQWVENNSKVSSSWSFTSWVFIFSTTRSLMTPSILRLSFCTVFSPYSALKKSTFYISCTWNNVIMNFSLYVYYISMLILPWFGCF